MRYEPVSYIYEIEIGAMAVFLIIMLGYFLARRFPNQRNRLFAMIMWTTVADVVLDIASSLIIDNIFDVPLALTYVVNTAFYTVTVLMLVLMMIYTYVLTGYINRQRLKILVPQLLRDIMKQNQVDPELLCFEVTETAATEFFELLRDCISDIVQLGCDFALDDFGTGYANISQLIQLPLPVLSWTNR